ncbi:MAG: helix-turn-helix transcriptional regulator [Acidimicrobiales bacterium]
MDVNTDDLLDAGDVAALLGLTHRSAVSTYRSRYDDFPEPVMVKGSGKCVLWRRQDVETWKASR